MEVVRAYQNFVTMQRDISPEQICYFKMCLGMKSFTFQNKRR